MQIEPNRTETIKCGCGTEFQWEIPDWMDTVDLVNKHRETLCPTCEDDKYAKRNAEDERIKAENRIIRIENVKTRFRDNVLSELPQLFKLTDITHSRFNLNAYNKIKDSKLTEEKPWLGLIGDTGECKSRIAALVAIDEMVGLAEQWVDSDQERYYKFVFTTGYEITELASIIQTGSFNEKEEARKRFDAIRDAYVLIIDDLGKGKVTESTAAALFSLIDHRYANLLRTIWTANSTPEQIAAPMSHDMAAPFAGRLNDHSRIFRIKS